MVIGEGQVFQIQSVKDQGWSSRQRGDAARKQLP